MAKHFFDRASGAYLGWVEDESRTAEQVFGRTDIDEALHPELDVEEQAVAALVDGQVVVDSALVDAQKGINRTGRSMVLFAAVLRVLIRIADGQAVLRPKEQAFIDWLKSDLIPVLPDPNAETLRALKTEVERRVRR